MTPADERFPVDTEQTPLVGRPSGRPSGVPSYAIKARKRTVLTSVLGTFVLFVVAMVGINALIVSQNAEQIVDKSVSMQVTDFGFEGFSGDGVDLSFEGITTVNYSQLENNYFNTILPIGAEFVRYTRIAPQEVEVYVKRDFESKYIRLGSAELPPFTVDVRNHHSTNLKFTVHISVDKQMFGAVGQLFGSAGQLLDLQVKTDVGIRLGLLPIGTFPLDVQRRVLNTIGMAHPGVEIKSFSFKQADDSSLIARAEALLTNPIPKLSLTIPAVHWAVSIDGCDGSGDLVLANGTLPKVSIEPGKKIDLNLSSVIDRVPSELGDECEDSKSPLDRIVEQLKEGKTPKVYINGTLAEASKVPKWIRDKLAQFKFPIPLPDVKKQFGNPVKSVKIEDISVGFPTGDGNGDGNRNGKGGDDSTALLSGNLIASIELPDFVDIPLNISQIKGNATLSHKGTKFALVPLKHWVPAETKRVSGNTFDVSAKLVDTPFTLLDSMKLQEIIADVFTKGHVTISVDGSADVGLEILSETVPIRGLPVKGKVDLEGSPFGISQ